MEITKILVKNVTGSTVWESKVILLENHMNGNLYEREFETRKQANEWIDREYPNLTNAVVWENSKVMEHKESGQFLEVNHEYQSVRTGLIEYTGNNYNVGSQIVQVDSIDSIINYYNYLTNIHGYSDSEQFPDYYGKQLNVQ